MRRTVLFVLLCVSLLSVAQQTTAPSAAGYPSGDQLQAPAPGHPLDQRDVQVLTGKDKPQQPPAAAYYGAPFYYPGYVGGGGGPMPSFDSSGLLRGRNFRATPRFRPLLFGNVNGRPFFIGNTGGNLGFTPVFFGPPVSPFFPVTPVFVFGNFRRTTPIAAQAPHQ